MRRLDFGSNQHTRSAAESREREVKLRIGRWIFWYVAACCVSNNANNVQPRVVIVGNVASDPDAFTNGILAGPEALHYFFADDDRLISLARIEVTTISHWDTHRSEYAWSYEMDISARSRRWIRRR